MKTLAERVQWILESRGMSDRALARASGVSHNYIGMLRKGGRGNRGLSHQMARKLAAATGVDPRWLMTGEGSPAPIVDPDSDPHSGRQQALALLEGRLPGPVRAALMAERPAEEWDVEKWLDRARALKALYTKVVQDFDEADEIGGNEC